MSTIHQAPFNETILVESQDKTKWDRFQHICFQSGYVHWSPEELKLVEWWCENARYQKLQVLRMPSLKMTKPEVGGKGHLGIQPLESAARVLPDATPIEDAPAMSDNSSTTGYTIGSRSENKLQNAIQVVQELAVAAERRIEEEKAHIESLVEENKLLRDTVDAEIKSSEAKAQATFQRGVIVGKGENILETAEILKEEYRRGTEQGRQDACASIDVHNCQVLSTAEPTLLTRYDIIVIQRLADLKNQPDTSDSAKSLLVDSLTARFGLVSDDEALNLLKTRRKIKDIFEKNVHKFVGEKKKQMEEAFKKQSDEQSQKIARLEEELEVLKSSGAEKTNREETPVPFQSQRHLVVLSEVLKQESPVTFRPSATHPILSHDTSHRPPSGQGLEQMRTGSSTDSRESMEVRSENGQDGNTPSPNSSSQSKSLLSNSNSSPLSTMSTDHNSIARSTTAVADQHYQRDCVGVSPAQSRVTPGLQIQDYLGESSTAYSRLQDRAPRTPDAVHKPNLAPGNEYERLLIARPPPSSGYFISRGRDRGCGRGRGRGRPLTPKSWERPQSDSWWRDTESGSKRRRHYDD